MKEWDSIGGRKFVQSTLAILLTFVGLYLRIIPPEYATVIVLGALGIHTAGNVLVKPSAKKTK